MSLVEGAFDISVGRLLFKYSYKIFKVMLCIPLIIKY